MPYNWSEFVEFRNFFFYKNHCWEL